MLKVGIVDDEYLARQTLVNYIARYCKNVEVLFTAANLNQALLEIEQHQPNAVFLDIEMPGASGMEIADYLAEDQRPMVVFTTAYADYAVDAFGIKAVDYLLKPIEVARLKQAIDRLREQQKQRSPQQTSLNISTLNGSKLVPFEEILYLKADGSYTELHTLSGEKLVISKKLFELEEQLSAEQFVRVHRSYLVNMQHVTEYVGGAKARVKLSSSAEIPVSRTKKDDVKSSLER